MLVDRKLPETIDTERLGAALARTVPWQAPQALTVFLQGELGAGKTTLVRGLLRAMGVQGSVRSPSYTLLESYELGGHRVLILTCTACVAPMSSKLWGFAMNSMRVPWCSSNGRSEGSGVCRHPMCA